MRVKKLTILLVLITLLFGFSVVQAEDIDFEGETVTFICNWEFMDPESETAREIMEDFNIG